MNTYLIIIEGNYDAINSNDYICHGYYIIILSSSPYNLQTDLNIDVQVISSGQMVYEGTSYFPIDTNYHYYASPKSKSNNTIVSLRTIFNDNVKKICYDLNNVVISSLRSI